MITTGPIGGECQPTLSFSVPLTPPSVNHYVKHTRTGRHYVTAEAKAYKSAIAIFARGRSVAHRKAVYSLEVVVYLGFNQRGDGDNFFKVIADGLKDAGVIHSDAAVKGWHIDVQRDRTNPRTEITVRAMTTGKRATTGR